MAGFDFNAAAAAGYSPEEIQQFALQQGIALNVGAPRGVQPGADPYAIPADSPLSGMSEGQQALAGVGRGLVHTGRSVGNLVGLVPDAALADEKQIDAPLLASPSGRFGNLVGESAATLPLGIGAGATLGKVAPILARSAIAQGATQGAVQGASTADPGERTKQALIGALTGGTLGAGAGATRTGIYGLERTPSAQTLLDQGVSLTPGQMNPGGTMNLLEQSAESLPIVKPLIHGARDAAEQDWQRAVFQHAAAPGAKITPSENASEMLQQAYDSYAPLYSQAHGYPVSPAVVRTVGGDIPLSQAFIQAARAPGIPASLQRSENAWLQDRLTQLPRNPQSEDLLQLRSDIRQRARTANLKNDTNSGHIANINGRAERTVTAALQSQLPAEPLQALATADSNYGNYKIVENAIAASKDNVVGLTPQKLSQAIYNATADPAYARGAGGPLRDLAQAGTQVFQTVVPPTGARVATLGAAALGAMSHPYIAIPAATGLLGASATRTGRNLAAGLTGPQRVIQQLTAALGSRIPQPMQNVGGQLLTRGAVGAAMPYGQQVLPAVLASALMLRPQLSQPER